MSMLTAAVCSKMTSLGLSDLALSQQVPQELRERILVSD